MNSFSRRSFAQNPGSARPFRGAMASSQPESSSEKPCRVLGSTKSHGIGDARSQCRRKLRENKDGGRRRVACARQNQITTKFPPNVDLLQTCASRHFDHRMPSSPRTAISLLTQLRLAHLSNHDLTLSPWHHQLHDQMMQIGGSYSP